MRFAVRCGNWSQISSFYTGSYGWGPVKERLLAAVPWQRGQNLSVLGAFDVEGMVHLEPVRLYLFHRQSLDRPAASG